MKKPLNYIQTIWFKLMNDDMTLSEMILLFVILAGISQIVIDALDPLLKGGI